MFSLAIFSKIRISSNLLLDEYVIDTIQRNKGKEHGYGYSNKISVNLKDEGKKIINAHYSHIKVGTPTFRHEDGNNNFVVRNRPLGWMYGSDGFEHNVGFDYYIEPKFLLKMSFCYVKYGEESILNKPYKPYVDYMRGKFPSGKVLENKYIKFYVKYWFKSNISLFISNDNSLIYNNINNINDIRISVDIYYPLQFNI